MKPRAYKLQTIATSCVYLFLVIGCSNNGVKRYKEGTVSAMKAYQDLLALFPEDNQGLGIEPTFPGAEHQPMTYGLVLSAEALHFKSVPNDESGRRVRQATQWLLDNRDLDGDGLPGWGLPQAWASFEKDPPNPPHQPYTITTSIVLNGLLDALAIPSFWSDSERREIQTLMAQVALRWCRNLWSEGYKGGFFWYSPAKDDAIFGINASAMFLGSLMRILSQPDNPLTTDERQWVWDRADRLAKAMVATVLLRDGAPYWDYVPVPNPCLPQQWTNDLLHHVYTLWGIELYRDHGGHVHLPWTRAKVVESVGRFWKNGRICNCAQDTVYVNYTKTNAEMQVMRPRLWGVGAMLAFDSAWGTPQQAAKTLEAITNAYGPWPRLTLYPQDSPDYNDYHDAFYPRYAAHVLWGLATHCFGSSAQ